MINLQITKEQLKLLRELIDDDISLLPHSEEDLRCIVKTKYYAERAMLLYIIQELIEE